MTRCGRLTSVAALLLLWLLASVRFPFTMLVLVASAMQVSPDLLLCLALVMFGGALGRPRPFTALAALLFVVVVLYRAAWEAVAVFLPHIDFSLADIAQTPALAHLVSVHLQWPSWCGVTIALVLLLVVLVVAGWCLLRLSRLASTRRRAALAGAALVVAARLALALHGRAGGLVAETWLGTIAADAWHRVREWRDPTAVEQPIRSGIAAAGARFAAVPGDLRGLDGADVHVLVLESYGRFALRHPDVAPAVAELWRDLAPTMDRAGVAVASSTFAPAISGGASWLAHAELYCGLPVPNGRTWRLLLASEFAPLPQRFRDAGYRTVEVPPCAATTNPAGPAGAGAATPRPRPGPDLARD